MVSAEASKTIYVLSKPGGDDDDELIAVSDSVQKLQAAAEADAREEIDWGDFDGDWQYSWSGSAKSCHYLYYRIRKVPVL